ncbi:hypothetical protein, partial [Caulobacter sp. S45]|uniref:hypothetical protein n=1 Tax=Caulobacter sp. S45 TaxID=1641861 RepID=UPI0015770B65
MTLIEACYKGATLQARRENRESRMSWREGYIADVAYTSGVYIELAPAHLSACALLGGVRPPDPSRP